MEVWVERELDGSAFADQRLKARLGTLLGDLGRRIGGTIPAACQDWAATKAAYRFFSNPRVDEAVILAGHFAATTAHFAATPETALVLHDTTEFSLTRDTPGGIGRGSFVKGRDVTHTVCGLLMHSSLVVTTAGVPLGLDRLPALGRTGRRWSECSGEHPDKPAPLSPSPWLPSALTT